MIGYVTLGSDDLARASAFYDALLAEFGAKRFMESDRLVIWGSGPGAPMLGVIRPNDGQPASVGNGVMVALAAGSREAVDKLHAKALSLGATDEGAPGERMSGFYGGYFRDLDGHKLNFFHMG
ncbi:VOC family protein [Algiphilus aromaticivorans]|jgi:catechol 2,3-dioxygenase-like lactoylglutathione lyase family enzyme|uniref:VOC family protein n=1 Tax=Algiphilus aromaticivorans TaxID=382454 RepID=UPI0005C23289|nr:VOC family protein [Algiphilus aromaticivorans]